MKSISLLMVASITTFIAAPMTARAGNHADAKITALIDREINAKLAAEKVKPAPRADEAELMRRVYLDLLGRTPTAEEAETFLNDKSADKATRLIDTLIDHPDMAYHWRQVIDLWLNDRSPVRNLDWDEYLRRSLEQNRPWDQMARDMIVPRYDAPDQTGAGHFLGQRANDLDAMTVAVSGSFFGVQMECAKCHDHPYVDDWKQENYYGLGSFLNRIKVVPYGKIRVLAESAQGDVTFKTIENVDMPARLLFLDGTLFEEPPLPKDEADQYVIAPNDKQKRPMVPKFSRREQLVEHAVGDHPYFRRSIVNRVWKKLMGRGLVEPVDQIHEKNPASHPELLEELGRQVAASGFDLKRLIASIMRSNAYQRSSLYPHGPFPRDTLYAAAIVKPLSPEQLAHSLAIATGLLDDVRARLERQKKEATYETVMKDFRSNGGNELIAKYVNSGKQFEATTSQALFMQFNKKSQAFFSPYVSGMKQLAAIEDDRQLVERAYLMTFSRRPLPKEVELMQAYVASVEAKREQAIVEAMWALLNSSEFRFIH